jgi:patatin-like phospholipase/acyl hydrolase
MSSLFNNPEYFSSNEEDYNNLNLINNEYINKNPHIFKSNNDVFSQNLEDIEINNLKEENYYNSNNILSPISNIKNRFKYKILKMMKKDIFLKVKILQKKIQIQIKN